MPRRNDRSNKHMQRALIAGAAARLIAEDGISDFTVAKRKAARGLGLPESAGLPDNTEVETELRTHQRLFQDQEQVEELAYLRRKAVEMMAILLRFNPYLTGPVLDGTAGRYTEVDLQLFTDSTKDVEIFLLNQQIDFAHSEPRTDRAEAVLSIPVGDTAINLVIYPPNLERVTLKTRNGRVRERARIDAVKALLRQT